MTVTAASFRVDYPEFTVDRYPDSMVNYYLNIAGLMLNASRWSTLLDVGTELFIAHHIAVERRAMDEAATGQPPGTTTGPISSKSVDKVSLSFDVGAAVEENGGHWNLTVYGTRFARLSKQFGAGPLQIGADAFIPPNSAQNAWGFPWWSTVPNPVM